MKFGLETQGPQLPLDYLSAAPTTPIADLVQRSARARAFLSVCLRPAGRNPFEKTVLNLMQRQDSDGSWGSTDFPPWNDVMTSFNLQSLLQAGFDEYATWTITPSVGAPYRGGISQGFEYLCRDRGQPGWGEDVHDTCQALIAMCNLADKSAVQPAMEAGYNYLLDELDRDFASQINSDWYGPGFWAVTLDALSYRDRYRDKCADLLERIPDMQQSDGSFCRPGNASTGLKVFHTASCLLALHAQGLPTTTPTIDAALDWLDSVQDAATGCWGDNLGRLNAIFTSYGVLALAAFRPAEDPVLRHGVQWLLDRQSEDGSVAGIEGTVMAAKAFAKATPHRTAQVLPVKELVDVAQLLHDTEGTIGLMERAVDAGKRENERLTELLRQEKSKYLIRITDRSAAVIGLVIGIISAILAVVPLVGSHHDEPVGPSPSVSAAR